MVVTARTGARRTLSEQRERYLDVLDGIRAQLHRARRDQITSSVAGTRRRPRCSTSPGTPRGFDRRRAGPGPPHRACGSAWSVPPALAARRARPATSVEHAEDAVCVRGRRRTDRSVRPLPISPVDSATRAPGSPSPARPAASARSPARSCAGSRSIGHRAKSSSMIACGGRSRIGMVVGGYLPHVVDPARVAVPGPHRRIVDTGSAAAVLASARPRRPMRAGSSSSTAARPNSGRSPMRPTSSCCDSCADPRTTCPAPTSGSNSRHRPRCPTACGTPCGTAHRRRPGPRPFRPMSWTSRPPDRSRACSPGTAGGAATPGPGRGPRSLPDALGITRSARWDVAASWRGRRPDDLLRVPIGVTDDGATVTARPQGIRARRDRTARPAGRGHRDRQVRAAAHARRRASPPPTHPTRSPSCSSTSRAAPPSHRWRDCRRWPAWSRTSLPTTSSSTASRDALRGEIASPAARLAGAGDLPDIDAYRRRALHSRAREPMPRLLVIVDEFTELVTARPDCSTSSRRSAASGGRSASTC